MMQSWSKALLAGPVGPYKKGQVIFESAVPGNYEVELLDAGKYEVYCIGAGSGANYSKGSGISAKVYIGSGGSGACFIGVLKIAKSILSIAVGKGGYGTSHDSSTTTSGAGGNSSIGDIVVSYGATGATIGRDHAIPGKGGNLSTISVTPIATSIHSAGNNGNYSTTRNSTTLGGAALYENYGKGGDNIGSSPQNGTSGYVKIIYKGK